MQIRGSVALAALATFGCGTLYEADVDVDVDLDTSGFTTLELDVPVPVRVRGASGSQLTIKGALTITSGESQARADELAEGYQVKTSSASEPYIVIVPVPGQAPNTPFPESLVFGGLEVQVPADTDLVLLQRGGTVDLAGVRAQMDIQSTGAVQVLGVENNAKIATAGGGIRVETRLLSGSLLDVTALAGPVNLIMPRSPSVRLEATAGPEAQVISQHPDFPPRPGQREYRATVGSGSASVVVDALRDNILLLP